MQDVIQQWDNAAAAFSEDQERSEFADSNKSVIEERFRRLNGERVLDLGCGYGWYTDFFTRNGADAVGVDGSEKMIAIAQERYPNLDFTLANIEKSLPFADGCFDIVFSNQVLMDIENTERVISECARILKENGVFYFGIVHPCFYDCKWLKDEKGYRYAKAMERYISSYRLTNELWGTAHFHRPMSFYLNSAAKHGLTLKEVCEPVSYDGVTKNNDLPLFFFAEFYKK